MKTTLGILMRALALLLAFTTATESLSAQTATGSISGTVGNASTRQFLNEAEVRVAGTNRFALTERDGSYILRDLAPGSYALEVSYAGLDTEKRSVNVTAGQDTKAEFNLTSGIYKLDAFKVAGEVEGNAAEINKQKKADYFMESISADSLGSVPDGNLGEFLRYMPGLQINYSNADANTVSMRGQDPDATMVTFDGQIPAAAGTPPRSSTGSSDASSRAFEFSQASINNVESIEVYKAPPPWMAPATGGVINAVTKNAFSQRGRRLYASTTLTGNSEMLHFGKVPGPGRRDTWRIKPGGTVSYSEALLDHRLGVSLSYSETNSINPSHNYAMGYSPFVAGTAAAPVTDSSRMNVNTFTLVDGPQMKARRNLGVNLDYRLSEHTVLKFSNAYNSYLSQNRSHTFRVRPGTVDAASTDRDAIIRNALVDVFDDYSDQVSKSYGYVGSVEHRYGPWKINYSANYSKSDSKVTDLPDMIQSIQFNLVAADAVVVHMTADPNSVAPLTLTQTAGPDLYDLHSYDSRKSLSLQTSPRFQNDRTWNLKADVKRDFNEFAIPFDVRIGANLYQLHRRKQAGQIVLNYTGPDGVANTADDPVLNASLFEDTTYGDKFIYGIRRPPLLDPYKFADFMKANPNSVQDIQGTNIQRQRVNSQQMQQDITAGYFASTVRPTNRLTLLGGVRVEETENFVRGAIRINSLGVGLPANSKQFFDAVYSQTQRVTSSYTDYFPNFQATYRATPNMIFRGALTRSLKRPDVQQILPNTTVNDTATPGTVTVNNAGILPQYSRNIDLGVEFYTQSAGKIELGWFKKTISSYILTTQTTIDVGNNNGFDGQYGGYLLNTQGNGGTGQFQGFEASLRQSFQPYLKALPEMLRGWTVYGSYTHFTEAQVPSLTGVVTKPLAPKFYDTITNIGLSYTTPRRTFYIDVRTSLLPEAVRTLPTATDLRPVYEKSHQRWDATARWRFSRRYALEFVAANITNDSFLDTWQGGRETSRRTFGTSYLLTFQMSLDDLHLPFVDR